MVPTRERAQAELKAHLAQAVPALIASLEQGPPPEARRRIRRLLETDVPLYPRESLMPLRAVELLESIGSDDARAVLADLAKGDPDAVLTREAGSALARLKKRP